MIQIDEKTRSWLRQNKDMKVTVCDACLRACCWQGEFMCDNSYSAGITEKTVAQLWKLQREHPYYYMPEEEKEIEEDEEE